MQCPVCNLTTLCTQELEPELFTLQCSTCDGHWIQSFRYWRWRNLQIDTFKDVPDATGDFGSVVEAKTPKLCPECRHILIPHRVGRGLDFRLDRCGGCGGIWLESGEWDMLKSRSLHLDVHRIFNAVWQRDVNDTDRAEIRQLRLTALLGEKDLAEVRRLREWIQSHPRKDTLLALLTQDQS